MIAKDINKITNTMNKRSWKFCPVTSMTNYVLSLPEPENFYRRLDLHNGQKFWHLDTHWTTACSHSHPKVVYLIDF